MVLTVSRAAMSVADGSCGRSILSLQGEFFCGSAKHCHQALEKEVGGKSCYHPVGVLAVSD
jgi:hypothetical protein